MREALTALVGARILTVFRRGTQAPAHLRAMAADFDEVRVADRGTTDPAGADIVVTATTATDPILFAKWADPGTHINAVGSSIPTAAELEPELLARAALFTDRRESLLNESGDYRRATHLIDPGHIRGELGEVLTGRLPGRTTPDEITVFKSPGLAVEDVVVARHLHEHALATGRGGRSTSVRPAGRRLVGVETVAVDPVQSFVERRQNRGRRAAAGIA
ncbi:hypothetical protein Aph02nite_43180 [Actinoplanes philippinensis]|uniref:Ornithine cyclodeaminase/mu-crystallin family protein n=1 Tax=Actinoplanes philippinensis TaxID=35752 RepID=A0A1I2H5V6_9ACTN|nr:ornithine cyclodeaminase family protein [Actinoplanes philippinensis]GIE78368.1 hypothetical protein Aph02nite_43180 [Actinoplanes philippinensis]SFF24367.1 Ornithine cyclodeaminase/mu-crystallin family protein [Actinoplanes philippinensis]